MTTKIFAFCLSILLLTACAEQKPIEELVSMDNVSQHLTQLDQIAKNNGGNRAVGTPGGIASKEYIKGELEKWGLTVTEQNFENRGGAKGCNLTTEIKGRNKQEVIMIGSHYDSVLFGPGINDNASGVAVVLEIIRAIRSNKIIPQKTLRFAFWDSEETGVEGSPAYYNTLTDADKQEIKAYLNVDMIASADGEIYISDTDGSTIESLLDEYKQKDVDEETIGMLKQMYESIKFADGSLELENLAKDTFSKLGAEIKEDLQFARNSDTNPFLEHIPTVGISAIKIETMTTDDGGEAILFAPCYHQACDDINNVDKNMLDVCLRAVAIMTQKLAVTGKLY